jgi:monoamine oxidase
MSRSLLMWNARRRVPKGEFIERREFLKGVALAGAGALLAPGALAQRAGRDSSPRVVVIGAGLAGLACAYELREAGADVYVFDARDRVGGRVVSMEDIVSGKIVEGGGEFIGANHPRWIGYAERFGIDLRPSEPDNADQLEWPILVKNRFLAKPEADPVWDALDRLTAGLNAPARAVIAHEPWASQNASTLDSQTVAQWLKEQDIDDDVRTLARASLEAELGVALEHASMLALLALVRGGGVEDFWAHSDDYRAVGGAQSLARAFADTMKGRVILGAPVEKIAHEGSRTGVTLADGKFVRADAIVLATPPSAWKTIALANNDTLLDRTVQMGLASKLIAIAPDAFWTRLGAAPFGLTDTDTQMIWSTTAGQTSPNPQDTREVMVGFSGGPAAERIRAVDRPTRDNVMLRAAARLWPGQTEGLMTVRFMDWRADRWAQAGYSFPEPGQVTTVCKALREPLGALHFAGEHCSTAFTGYMEGALESGSRAARRIVAS